MNEFQVKEIPLELIDDFPDHPFKVRDDTSMCQLVESVMEHGVLVPAIVRPKENGRYEMISGHRRKRASELADINAMSCMVCEFDDDTATIVMVDSNLHRPDLLPSEKAFAYLKKYDAMKHQGKSTSTPLVSKLRSNELLAEQVGESREQIRRYIRLTNLVPELLQFVDEGKMKMRPAVEVSYLDEDCQRDLVEYVDFYDVTPSHAQAIRMRRLFEDGKLDNETLEQIMSEDKPNQKEHISIPVDRIRSKLPKTPSKRIDFIVNAIDHYSKYLERKNNKDAR